MFVKTALGATAFVAAKVDFGDTVVMIVIRVLVFEVATWLLGGAILILVEAARRTSEFVAIIFEREGAVIRTFVRVVVVAIVAVVIVVALAQWLLGGAILILVEAACRPSVLGVAFVVKAVGAVVGSNYVAVAVVVIALAQWLLSGAILILVEAACRPSVIGVAFVVEAVGAVVGSNYVVVAVAVVVAVSRKKHLVDNVDDPIAGRDVKFNDFWQGILAVAIADL